MILGAGLTGLSTAWHLRSGYRLLERAGDVGGLCVTREDRGYRFDVTGHLLHLRDRGIRRWIESLLGGRLLRIDRRARIFSHGVHTRYPFQANTFGLPPRVACECLLGFVRAWAARGRGPEPADFEGFILRHFGEGIARRFMIPYNRKIWGVHPREMSTAWTRRFVPKPDLEDVVAGAVGLDRPELGYNAEFLYPKLGIGELPAAIHRTLERKAETSVRVRSIDWRRRIVHAAGEAIPYRALVSTIPLPTLVSLLADPPARVRAAASGLRHVGLRYLDVAMERAPGNDFHWTYVPERRFPFYRVGAYSNFSAALAPRGAGSLYVEMTSRAPAPAARLAGRAIPGLIEMGLLRRASDVRFVRARWIPHAYVVYDHRWERAVGMLHPFLEENGIFSRGRYGRWEYSSMEDALLAGREAAARTMEAIDR
ncbi:MAG: FAD-dependent oxidoreductase [Myxococcota bacterium]|nr:FAD-dependent oxidoreductase [Myxococcota bacterium]